MFRSENILLVCILLLTEHVCLSVIGDEILGCGGFVKSEASLDFSKVEVRLVTPNGIQKYQTECAPNNGYYMVPFIENGDFVLKLQPPSGWAFEPMSVNLHVDGVNDPCSQGKDINFQFLGFSVTGQVKSAGLDVGGPAGVALKLMSQDSSKLIAETSSTDGGSFQFRSVMPGRYKIRASHQTFSFKQNEVSVAVAKDSVHCAQSLVVSGYAVRGKVNAADLPVEGVHFLLFSHKKMNSVVKGCDKSPPGESKDVTDSEDLHFLCSTSSDGKGDFVFPSLPPSEYTLFPFHKGKTIQFDVEPKKATFSVTHGDVTLEQKFSVTGFSVTGKVLDGAAPKGKPVRGAQVFVNGVKQAVTDQNGLYRLQSMTSGSYKITVEKEDVFFPKSNVRIGSDTPRLSDIVADRFSVCGQVHVKVKNVKSFDVQRVEMVFGNSDGSERQRKKVDANGKFCFQQPAGEYILKPVVPDTSKTSWLQFHPAVAKVSVSNGPRKDIKFEQVLEDIEVRLTCIDGCTGVTVEMRRDGEPASSVSSRKVTKSNSVIFQNLLPGRYHFAAKHENWCWLQDEAVLDTKSGEKNLVELKQSGYRLICSVSHNLRLEISRGGKPAGSFDLTKGKNQMCVAEPGEYILSPESCHVFAQDEYSYKTSDPQPVVLQAIAHDVTVRILSTHKDKDLKLILQSSVLDKALEIVPKLEKGTDSKFQEFNYVANYRAREMESLSIATKSAILLFEPESAKVVVNSGVDCSRDVVVMNAFKGLFIEGVITPVIKDVRITISTDQEQPDVYHYLTDAMGKYKSGPLNPRVSYAIAAEKEGYSFAQSQAKVGNFQAKKFSKMSFKVETDGDDNGPLKGVFLTVSGGSFRSNNLTDSDGGLVLRNLQPGQYYFKAVMKEFEFLPSSEVVELAEGQELDVKIVGKRVAFSCFGKVRSLNGQPERDVIVQAFETSGDGSHAEETKTDDEGMFRIKGLLPNAEYKVVVKESDSFERFSPQESKISVQQRDITGLDFVAFRKQTQFEISGNVVTDNEYLKYLKVVLYKRSDTSAPVATASLTQSPFFHFPPLPRNDEEYQVVVEASLEKSRYSFTEPAAAFYAAGSYKHLILLFHPQVKTYELEPPQASYLTLPVTCLVLLLAYNYAKIRSILEKFFSKQSSDNAESTSSKLSTRKSRKDK